MSVNAVAGFAIPLGVGVWSDRRQAAGLGRRLPFMIGGTALAVGGLLAIAVGSGSSYIGLGLAAAVVYTGLNGLTTAHRILIADDVADERRPVATSGQEVAAALGAGLAVGIGAALIDPAPGAAFALAAAVLVLAAVPTLLVTRRLRLGTATLPRPTSGARASLSAAFSLPGARQVLVAQTLWVFAYAALPAFFVLYAQHELGLSLGAAGALPLAFGLLIAPGWSWADEQLVSTCITASLLARRCSAQACCSRGRPRASPRWPFRLSPQRSELALSLPSAIRTLRASFRPARQGRSAASSSPPVASPRRSHFHSPVWLCRSPAATAASFFLGAGVLVAIVPLIAAERQRQRGPAGRAGLASGRGRSGHSGIRLGESGRGRA